MTKEELKEKLKGAMYAQRTLEGELDKLQELRNIAQKITPTYSLAPGGVSGGQRIENAVIKIADLENSIREDIEKLVSAIAEVRQLIACIEDPLLRAVLYRRYLCYQKWEQIAADLNYSWRRAHQLHNKALNVILIKNK
ncbi:hypothetical protein [uncultured Phascolarctobacterium sp.]|uniref:hypothetical protein n=1 Tax=uncultured Phascolarctobacterium sp. TaxID=512296 RepID=UPI0026127386|nr:hypothetical protein [uncultured Phascolarctobacterium sp.]